MGSVGDKVVLGNLSLRELLVLAFAVGGEDAAGAIREASRAIAALDGRSRSDRGLKLRQEECCGTDGEEDQDGETGRGQASHRGSTDTPRRL
jgi:hypothetical protein